MRLPVDISVEEERRIVLEWMMEPYGSGSAIGSIGSSFAYKGVQTLPAVPSEPLPFFLDPEQIAALAPEIDWDRRVGDRIRAFLEWACK